MERERERCTCDKFELDEGFQPYHPPLPIDASKLRKEHLHQLTKDVLIFEKRNYKKKKRKRTEIKRKRNNIK